MKYYDPLHIGWGELTVKDLDGNEKYVLNKRLFDSQMCWENLEKIKEVHSLKLLLYSMIEEETNPKILKDYAQDVTLCEFELQRLWKFPQDAKFHRFWDTPKCQCPKIDNEEAYGTSYAITSSTCPLHGSDQKNDSDYVDFNDGSGIPNK